MDRVTSRVHALKEHQLDLKRPKHLDHKSILELHVGAVVNHSVRHLESTSPASLTSSRSKTLVLPVVVLAKEVPQQSDARTLHLQRKHRGPVRSLRERRAKRCVLGHVRVLAFVSFEDQLPRVQVHWQPLLSTTDEAFIHVGAEFSGFAS